MPITGIFKRGVTITHKEWCRLSQAAHSLSLCNSSGSAITLCMNNSVSFPGRTRPKPYSSPDFQSNCSSTQIICYQMVCEFPVHTSLRPRVNLCFRASQLGSPNQSRAWAFVQKPVPAWWSGWNCFGFFLLHLATRAGTEVLGASPLGCLPVTTRCFNLDCLNHQSTTIPAQGHTGAKSFHWSCIKFPSSYKWAWAVLIISTLSWMAQKGKKRVGGGNPQPSVLGSLTVSSY